MTIVITIIHVIVSIGLILVVLLQQGKGAEVGAVFGGSSFTIFGSSGAGNFLIKMIIGMVIVFMMTFLTLGYFAGHRPSATIFDNRTLAAPFTKTENAPSNAQGPAATASPPGTEPQKSTTP